MYIVGIGRAKCFSPNSAHRDDAILQAVKAHLEAKGHEVVLYDEEALPEHLCADAIYSMARSPMALSRLQQCEARGTLVVNASEGVQHCDRRAMTRLFEAGRVPHAATHFVATHQPPAEALSYPCWVKRGQDYSATAQDVCFVQNEQELQATLAAFAARGIAEVAVSRHEVGDLIKFYGVADTPFFRFSYATRSGSFSKFGWETHNGQPHEYAFSHSALQAEAHRTARLFGVPVYGGDAIVKADGTFLFIDFNDFPSFSAYLHEAAEAIATYIITRVREVKGHWQESGRQEQPC